MPTYYGTNGKDLLIGSTGPDVLIGGAGDDTYLVDDPGDVVVETSGEGFDTVAAKVSYALNSGAEVEVLSTTDDAGTGVFTLLGNELGQTIIGNAGVNYLVGGGGGDALVGLGGDDFLFVSAGDIVVEAAGGGYDNVLASTDYALNSGAHAEILSTANHAGTGGLTLLGNELGQIIIGNAGVNYLVGGGGVDALVGLGGDDFLFVDADDTVIEAAGGGYDNVLASESYVLNSGAHVEVLSTTSHAGTAAINLAGNEVGQIVLGNAGNNILDGGLGADALVGFGGADTFAFTTALGNGNVDSILGFEAGTDKIALDDGIFTGLSVNQNSVPFTLATAAFHTGSAAHDADDRIIYDASTGALYFDADGSGAGAAVQFASLTAGLSLSASDFVVINDGSAGAWDY
jgi:Ca2+-binding RTX toxin-like protein